MALKVGDKAPDFTLKSDSGQDIKLSSYKGKKVILFFYPKDDTPGCTTQACGFRDNYTQISDGDAVVFGISPDTVASHTKFKKKQDLPYPLLSDPEHKVIDLYGAWGEKTNYGRKYMGVIRSHVVINEKGKIADIKIGVSPFDSVNLAVSAVSGK